MEELGINIIQIVAYVIIFFLLYFFTRGFLKKAIDNLENRKKTIEDGIQNAKEAEVLKTQKLGEAEEERKKIIDQAYSEAKEIVDRAKAKEQSIIADASDTKNVFLQQAKKEIEELKERSKHEGLKEANAIISLAIAKAFEGIDLDEKQQEEFIKKSLGNLKK